CILLMRCLFFCATLHFPFHLANKNGHHLMVLVKGMPDQVVEGLVSGRDIKISWLGYLKLDFVAGSL
ncbi:hypothetical protein ACJX0J_028773, partial [Zea mays]